MFLGDDVLQDCLQLFLERRTRCGSNDFVDYLSILDEQDGGHVAYTELYCQVFALFHIALAYYGLSLVVGCKSLDDGSDALAWSAPGCPKV